MLHLDDKRDFFRMIVNTDLELYVMDSEAGRKLDGICRDLSATGMSIEIDEPLELGTCLRAKLESSIDSVPALDAVIKVIRCGKESEDCFIIGAEIMEMNE
ncbi:PilZ domain-containing protein [Algicola sagamiensis]|uniref:PilZ domain-containing protein n=1 Tax=Algicola sagamiensis TaxID=163869 RepID=UPI00037845BC|nr:PilZ domain-containing protein [Algicola sagamiensis]